MEVEQGDGGLGGAELIDFKSHASALLNYMSLISGMCLLHSPGGLHWKAGQQGVQIFWCSPDRRPQC